MNNLWFIIDNIYKWTWRIGAILFIAIILIAGIYLITFFILKKLCNWRENVLKKK
jgi:hypothetical protein